MAVAPAVATASASTLQNVLVAVIGNALEWFDVIVYGFFAPVIAKLFFPAHDPAISLLLTLGSFGVSFLIRPLGAVIIGRYADAKGRKAALVLVSRLMLVGTTIIAVTPTYASIGLAAPGLLLFARLVQGFSAGGEFGSATAFLAEQNPARRAFYSSWQFASQGVATLLASGFGLIVTTILDAGAVASWGWRLPFFFGMLIGPAAYLVRSQAHETAEFEQALEQGSSFDGSGFALRVFIGVGAVLVATVAMYLMLYIPTLGTAELGLPAWSGYLATLLTGATLVIVPPVAGALADRIGRLRIAIPAAIALVVLPMPLFALLVAHPSAGRLVLVQGLLGLSVSVYFGGLPAILTELFPVSRRTTGLSLCYNIAVVLAGGFAPMIFSTLILLSGSKAAPGAYLTLAALLSFAALVIAGRRKWTW